MPGTVAPIKAAPRSNVSVTLSVEEIAKVDEAAHRRGESRASFIRSAAVEAATRDLVPIGIQARAE